MSRLRLVGVSLQPMFMVDDGDNLTPLEVPSVNITAADWPNVTHLFATAMEALRVQVEGDLAEPVEPTSN